MPAASRTHAASRKSVTLPFAPVSSAAHSTSGPISPEDRGRRRRAYRIRGRDTEHMARERTIHLIDGSAQFYRAYFAIRGLSTSRGLPTNATYGFTTMLRKLYQDEQPERIGISFDLPGPTFRHEEYKEYKATRRKMDDELAVQLPYVRRVCEAFRLPVLELSGCEADDVIATLARQAVEAGLSRRRGLGRQGPAAARERRRAGPEPRPRGLGRDPLRPRRGRGEVRRPARARRGRAGAGRRRRGQRARRARHRREGRARPHPASTDRSRRRSTTRRR